MPSEGENFPISKVLYEKDGRIGRVTLNLPDVLNAIDGDLPKALADCVERANADPGVYAIVLSGAGRAFCAGYDLTAYAQSAGPNNITQEKPWDPMKDYAFMMRNTELFMSLWRSYRPVICKAHGFAIGRLELQAPRGRSRMEGGGAEPRPGHLGLDRQPADQSHELND